MSQRIARIGQLSTGLQAAANIATLIAACLLSTVLVRTYFLPRPALQPAVAAPAISNTALGKDLKPELPDVNWSANGETVLLALSTHCHFCTDSAPFFRQLSEKSGKKFKIVAVLPESAKEAQDYLKRKGVHVDQVKQMSLDKLGVDGTPTMLLLDNRGTVTQSWFGMLDSEAQSQALKVIDAGHPENRRRAL